MLSWGIMEKRGMSCQPTQKCKVFVWEIAVKIPSQKINLGNLSFDFLVDCFNKRDGLS